MTKPAFLFAGVLLLVLQGLAIERQSLIGDGAYHLVAGEQSLRYGQNRLNLEHPPLVKLLAAIPLLSGPPLSPPTTVNHAITTSLRVFDDPHRLTSVRRRARGILFLVFALPLLIACFYLGQRVAGSATGGALLALVMGLAFPTLPFLSVIQTDTAVSLGFVLTVVAAIAYVERPDARRAALLGLGLGVALAAKFSGILVAPVVAVALVLASARRLRHRLLDLAVTGSVAVVLVLATYAAANYRYDPEVGRDTIRRYCRSEAMLVEDQMLAYEAPLLAIEPWAPNLAQWLTGFLGIRIQNQIGVYASYAFGSIDSRGRVWYFPALFLVKTPIALLAASAAALVAFLRKPTPLRPRATWLLIGTAVFVYVAVALSSSYNLGVRHLMPVLPFLFLPAVAWAARAERRRLFLLGAVALESVLVSPLWMSSTNTWWLGRYNPTRFSLSAGNSDYRQNFLVLAREAEKRGIERLHVLYPLVSEKEVKAYVPFATLVEPGDDLTPGWYAVNLRVEQYIPAILEGSEDAIYQHASLERLAGRWLPLWQTIASGEDHGYVAGTFHLFRWQPR